MRVFIMIIFFISFFNSVRVVRAASQSSQTRQDKTAEKEKIKSKLNQLIADRPLEEIIY